jgi:hypothetical protein
LGLFPSIDAILLASYVLLAAAAEWTVVDSRRASYSEQSHAEKDWRKPIRRFVPWSPLNERMHKELTYWSIFGSVSILESCTILIVESIPFYFAFKVVFFLGLPEPIRAFIR